MATGSGSLEHLTSIYQDVINDVIRNVRDEFLNEAVELEVLEDLRQIWLNKLNKSGAVDRPSKPDPPPRPVSAETKQSSRQQAHNASKHSTPSLPPPLVSVSPSNPLLLSQPSLSQPPALISTPPVRDPSERETITVIHHAPPRSQATPTATSVIAAPSQSTQPSSIVLQPGKGTSVGSVGSSEGSSTGGTPAVPPLLPPSALSSLHQATLQQGMVPIQTTQGTMLVPLSSFVALQMRQQQQAAATSQGSKSTSTSSEKSSQDSNKEVHQLDGYPPPQLTGVPVADPTSSVVQTYNYSDTVSHIPLSQDETLLTNSAPIDSQSHGLKSSVYGEEVLLPAVLREQSVDSPIVSTRPVELVSKDKNSQNLSPKKQKNKRRHFPKPGDMVEFVFENTSGEFEQLDSKVKGQRSKRTGDTDRGQRFIVQLDGALDGSSSEDDSDLDDDSSDDDLGGGSDVVDEDPLNSDDDVDDDAEEQKDFDTNDTIVCLWEKVYRVRTKWKFLLKDGIMHLGGFDYVFQKGTGEADW